MDEDPVQPTEAPEPAWAKTKSGKRILELKQVEEVSLHPRAAVPPELTRARWTIRTSPGYFTLQAAPSHRSIPTISSRSPLAR
jgi:hypothetical protein